jgi:hypothetical protein
LYYKSLYLLRARDTYSVWEPICIAQACIYRTRYTHCTQRIGAYIYSARLYLLHLLHSLHTAHKSLYYSVRVHLPHSLHSLPIAHAYINCNYCTYYTRYIHYKYCTYRTYYIYYTYYTFNILRGRTCETKSRIKVLA